MDDNVAESSHLYAASNNKDNGYIDISDDSEEDDYQNAASNNEDNAYIVVPMILKKTIQTLL